MTLHYRYQRCQTQGQEMCRNREADLGGRGKQAGCRVASMSRGGTPADEGRHFRIRGQGIESTEGASRGRRVSGGRDIAWLWCTRSVGDGNAHAQADGNGGAVSGRGAGRGWIGVARRGTDVVVA